ncbi:hypothetical protein BDV11DRAFT_157822 [Aspergillus similis]
MRHIRLHAHHSGTNTGTPGVKIARKRLVTHCAPLRTNPGRITADIVHQLTLSTFNFYSVLFACLSSSQLLCVRNPTKKSHPVISSITGQAPFANRKTMTSYLRAHDLAGAGATFHLVNYGLRTGLIKHPNSPQLGTRHTLVAAGVVLSFKLGLILYLAPSKPPQQSTSSGNEEQLRLARMPAVLRTNYVVRCSKPHSVLHTIP